MAKILFKFPIKISNSYQKNGGYTLIELLIVIMTMVILFSLGYANFRGFQRRQQLEGIVRMVKGDLRLAQSSALSGKKPPDCAAAAGTLESYSLGYSGETKYTISAVCSGTAYSVKPVDLVGAKFDSDFGTIRFNVLGRGTSLSANLNITLTSQYDASLKRVITVSTSGVVQ